MKLAVTLALLLAMSALLVFAGELRGTWIFHAVFTALTIPAVVLEFQILRDIINNR